MTGGSAPSRVRSDVSPTPAPPPPRDAAGALAGWVRVEAPVELQLSIDGAAAGTTRQAPVLLAAGTHDIVAASDRAGFRATERVTIEAGRVRTVTVAVPNGSLSVQAQPQVDVLVDGAAVGTTPIDRLALAAGVRRVVLRGAGVERSYDVVIREGKHTGLTVDLQRR